MVGKCQLYLNQYQFIPTERTQEMVKDIFGLQVSDGLIQSSTETSFTNLKETTEIIKQKLREGKIIHNDETGIRCERRTQWIHNASNGTLTNYSIHSKRGNQAIEEINILPQFKGISIHDRWASYDKYSCVHALCNSHLLRDLKFVYEDMNRKWAGEMIEVMIRGHELKKEGVVAKNKITRIENKMDDIIRRAIKESQGKLFKKEKEEENLKINQCY